MADYSNLSASEYLSLMSGESSLRSAMENEANTWRQFTNRPTNFSLGSSGTASMLKSFMSQRDEEILAEILKQQREAVNNEQLELGDISKWSSWFSKQQGFPAEYGARARAAYESMSDQFRTGQLHAGKVKRQGQEISAAEHQAALEAGEIESQQLALEKDRADLAQGKIRKFFRGNEEITEVFKDGRWVFHSSAPRWDADDDTTKLKNFDAYIEMLEESRGEKVGAKERGEIFNKLFLKQQIETSQAWTQPMIKAFSDKKTAFGDTTGMIKRMLKQIANPQVVLGSDAGLFKGIEGIGSQFRQLAQSFGDDDFIDPRQYDFGTAEYSGQLAANITGLAYTLAKAVEGGRLSESDVQLRIDMITGGGMSKDVMAANLMEIYNNSVRSMKNAYLDASDASLPGSTVRTVGEFLDSRKAGTLVIEPEIKNGERTGRMALGYYASDGIFKVISHWYQEQ